MQMTASASIQCHLGSTEVTGLCFHAQCYMLTFRLRSQNLSRHTPDLLNHCSGWVTGFWLGFTLNLSLCVCFACMNVSTPCVCRCPRSQSVLDVLEWRLRMVLPRGYWEPSPGLLDKQSVLFCTVHPGPGAIVVLFCFVFSKSVKKTHCRYNNLFST